MAGSGWTVTSQTPNQMIVTDAGVSEQGTYVYFRTGNGHAGSVFVPDNHYNAKNVRQMIAAKAALIDEVGALTQPGTEIP